MERERRHTTAAQVNLISSISSPLLSFLITSSLLLISYTDQSNIYSVTYGEEKGILTSTLRSTCHFAKINAVAFAWYLPPFTRPLSLSPLPITCLTSLYYVIPLTRSRRDYSALFVTCSQGGIRVWNAQTSTQLLRIDVAGVECLCVAIARDGKSIVSGWKDSKIRAFTPQTGKLLYTIHDAHPGEVCHSLFFILFIYYLFIILVFILSNFDQYNFVYLFFFFRYPRLEFFRIVVS